MAGTALGDQSYIDQATQVFNIGYFVDIGIGNRMCDLFVNIWQSVRLECFYKIKKYLTYKNGQGC